MKPFGINCPAATRDMGRLSLGRHRDDAERSCWCLAEMALSVLFVLAVCSAKSRSSLGKCKGSVAKEGPNTCQLSLHAN